MIDMKFKTIFGAPLQRPFLVAGPCSAETEEQVLTTAHQLKEQQQVDFQVPVHLLNRTRKSLRR